MDEATTQTDPVIDKLHCIKKEYAEKTLLWYKQKSTARLYIVRNFNCTNESVFPWSSETSHTSVAKRLRRVVKLPNKVPGAKFPC